MQFLQNQKSIESLPGIKSFSRNSISDGDSDTSSPSSCATVDGLELFAFEIPEICIPDFEPPYLDPQQDDLSRCTLELEQQVFHVDNRSEMSRDHAIISAQLESQGNLSQELGISKTQPTPETRQLMSGRVDRAGIEGATLGGHTADNVYPNHLVSGSSFASKNIQRENNLENIANHPENYGCVQPGWNWEKSDSVVSNNLNASPRADPGRVSESHVFIPTRNGEMLSLQSNDLLNEIDNGYVTQSPTLSNTSFTYDRGFFGESCDPTQTFSYDFNTKHTDSRRSLSPVSSPDPDEEQAREDSEKTMHSNFIPDKKKDDKYWRRRLRNNRSAKKSRDAKRAKELFVANRIAALERENSQLKMTVNRLLRERSNKQTQWKQDWPAVCNYYDVR